MTTTHDYFLRAAVFFNFFLSFSKVDVLIFFSRRKSFFSLLFYIELVCYCINSAFIYFFWSFPSSILPMIPYPMKPRVEAQKNVNPRRRRRRRRRRAVFFSLRTICFLRARLVFFAPVQCPPPEPPPPPFLHSISPPLFFLNDVYTSLEVFHPFSPPRTPILTIIFAFFLRNSRRSPSEAGLLSFPSSSPLLLLSPPPPVASPLLSRRFCFYTRPPEREPPEAPP